MQGRQDPREIALVQPRKNTVETLGWNGATPKLGWGGRTISYASTVGPLGRVALDLPPKPAPVVTANGKPNYTRNIRAAAGLRYGPTTAARGTAKNKNQRGGRKLRRTRKHHR